MDLLKCFLILIFAASVLTIPLLNEQPRSAKELDITQNLPYVAGDTINWTDEEGTHRMSYTVDDSHWRAEKRYSNGEVEGEYGYRTPEGDIVLTSYTAGVNGYNADVKITPAEKSEPLPLLKSASLNNLKGHPTLLHRKLKVENQHGSSSNVDTRIIGKQSTSSDAIPYGALKYSDSWKEIKKHVLQSLTAEDDMFSRPTLKFANPNQSEIDEMLRVIWQPTHNANNLPAAVEPNFEIIPAVLSIHPPPSLKLAIKQVPVYAARPIRSNV